MAALILVDLQVDFLGQKEDRPPLIDPRPFKDLLPSVLREFTTRRRPVVWVRSEYPLSDYGISKVFPPPAPPEELEHFEAYLSKTHTGSRFCIPSTPGADIVPILAHLKQANHMEIVKTWYSSFTETPLHENLQSTSTTHLYIAGVTTNTCVAATSVHARRLGYQVTIITDLAKAIKVESHDKAIQTLTISHYNINTCTSSQVGKNLAIEINLPTLYWVNGSIPSWRVMLALAAKRIPYAARRLRVMTNPKETRSAEFAQINPRCKTPTFVDTDGTVVIESLAILQYLEHYYPSPSLLPPAGDKAAWTQEMVRFNETENPHNLYEPIELLFLPSWKNHQGSILQAYGDILEELEFWEGYLTKDPFVSGTKIGLADCAFYPILAYMVHRGLDLRMKFGALEAYYVRCREHWAVIEACPDRWEEPGKSLFARCEMLQKEGL